MTLWWPHISIWYIQVHFSRFMLACCCLGLEGPIKANCDKHSLTGRLFEKGEILWCSPVQRDHISQASREHDSNWLKCLMKKVQRWVDLQYSSVITDGVLLLYLMAWRDLTPNHPAPFHSMLKERWLSLNMGLPIPVGRRLYITNIKSSSPRYRQTHA